MSTQTGLAGEMPRPIKVVMMGAGSSFTNAILKDIVLVPGNQGGELHLVDIDERRLALADKLMCVILKEAGQEGKWRLTMDTDRRKALEGADYIVNSIEVAGLACVRPDNDIPLQFGVSQNIGDTIGPGGLMKALRTVPVWLDILRDAEALCPEALVLNYTNPMNIMCLAAQRTSKMRVVGLCHSVQGTSQMLARYAGIEYERMEWKCAGINHLAWFTELRGCKDGRMEGWKGGRVEEAIPPRLHTSNPPSSQWTDLYPNLMEQARDPNSDFRKAEPVRCDMMLHFGAFITESSGHLSEYLPYYRKRPDLLKQYTDTGYRGEESFYANNWPTWRANQDAYREKLLTGEEKVDMTRTLEYGAWIIEAIEKNQPYVIHGNVPNLGFGISNLELGNQELQIPNSPFQTPLIPNLPHDGCVEIACLIDKNGVQPQSFGPLPKQMAAICDSNMRMFDIAADACIERSKEKAIQSLMLDPLTAAVCCPAEITEMAEKLFEAEAEFLEGYG